MGRAPTASPPIGGRIGMVGNALEWYDFAIYGYFAAVLGKHFFPSDDPAVSVIAAFGVFAIGFSPVPSDQSSSAPSATGSAGAKS